MIKETKWPMTRWFRSALLSLAVSVVAGVLTGLVIRSDGLPLYAVAAGAAAGVMTGLVNGRAHRRRRAPATIR